MRNADIEVVVERGSLVEARHQVRAVRLWAEDTVPEDPAAPLTLLRSAAKPLQSLALAACVPDLQPEELAVICSSHDGSPQVTALVGALLHRSGSAVDDLRCCTPDGDVRLRHPCSGHHAGMLLLARANGWPAAGYGEFEHPVQQTLLRSVANLIGRPVESFVSAPDGCGVPTLGCTLTEAAIAFARLGTDGEPYARLVLNAMLAHTSLIGGHNAPDVTVMRHVRGAVAKFGNEGLLCVALPDGSGVALKVADGNPRALAPSVGALLAIDSLTTRTVRDDLDRPVGVLRARLIDSVHGGCARAPATTALSGGGSST